jgi:hypothetical protein
MIRGFVRVGRESNLAGSELLPHLGLGGQTHSGPPVLRLQAVFLTAPGTSCAILETLVLSVSKGRASCTATGGHV